MANKQTISSAELSSFCSQVALILSAGLPLYDGMETLAEASKNSPTADYYQKASQVVNETGSLYEAMKRDDRWPNYLTEMVGVGEQTGQLEEVMNSLSDYYGREDRIRTAVVSAVTYPLVLGGMLVLIIGIMLWKVLPVFRRVLASMGATSNAGSGLMHVGSIIGWVVLAVVGLVILAVLVGLIILRTPSRDKLLAWIQKRFPSIHRMSMNLSASRVASVLSMMFQSGFPTAEAFRILPTLLNNEDAKAKVEKVGKDLEKGGSLADAISEVKLFDDLHERMVHMGVAAGKEDEVMAKLAEIYEEKVENGITSLVSIIEPTLIALLSLVIGAVLLSVMLPMAGILTTML
ncbi:MAG: type II secretion system F family protein [Clostridia bacterium]|nr:type II secretion system F family protein [Clostridia bacterium]